VCISDTHNEHANLTLPPGDILIHTGDILTESGCRHTKQVQTPVDPPAQPEPQPQTQPQTPTQPQAQTQTQTQSTSRWSWLCGSKKSEKETESPNTSPVPKLHDRSIMTDEIVDIPTTSRLMNSQLGDELVDGFLQWFGRAPYPHKVLIGGNHDSCLQNLGKGRIRNTLERYSAGTAMYLEHEAALIGQVKIFGSPFAHYPSKNRAYRKEREELNEMDYSELKNAHIFLTHMPLVLPNDDGSTNHCDPLSLKLQKYNDRLLHIAGHCHWAHGLYRTKYGIPSIVASISSSRWLHSSDLIGNQQGERGDRTDRRYGGYNLHFPPWVVDIEIEQGIPQPQDKWSLIFSNAKFEVKGRFKVTESKETEQKEMAEKNSSDEAIIKPATTPTSPKKPAFLIFAPVDHADVTARVTAALKDHFQIYHCSVVSEVQQLLSVDSPAPFCFQYCLSKLGTRDNKATDFFSTIRAHVASSKCKIIIHSATAASDSLLRKNLDNRFVIHRFVKDDQDEAVWLKQLTTEMQDIKSTF